MYKLVKNPRTNDYTTVLKLADRLYVPFDPANTDYQEYLRWVGQGNTPEPADEIEGAAE